MYQQKNIGVIYDISQEQEEYTRQYFEIKKSIGKRKNEETNGNAQQQYNGILAQVVGADLLNVPRPDPHDGMDGGIDYIIGDKIIDMKALTRRDMSYCRSWDISVYKDQYDAFKTDVYLFATILSEPVKSLCIYGWIKKDEVLQFGKFVAQGVELTKGNGEKFTNRLDTYFLKPQHTHPWKSPESFTMEMGMYA